MEMIRSFISFVIPATPSIRTAQEKLRSIKGTNVPKEIHLTLRFLGDVESKKIRELSERMKALEKYETFNVAMKGLGAFPNNKEPRVVWIGAELGEPFKDILSDLDGMLEASSISYDMKPFKAHVTIGRVKTPSGALTSILNDERSTDFGSFSCPKILLMKSDLTQNGAVHSVIASFRLAERS